MAEQVKTGVRPASIITPSRIADAQDKPEPPRTRGLAVARRWTRPGIHPFDEIAWELRAASIANEKGEVVFEQKDVEVPAFYSQLATNVVVSKYFRGALGTPQRERSVKQLISRVANTITDWGIKDSYFAATEDAETFRAELTYLLVNQHAAFNSPVWFNVGIEPRPQCSACQPYHALVNTVHGLMPIGEIVERNLIGLPVYDGAGLSQVLAVKQNGHKPVYRIRLNDGFSVEATGDHLVCAHTTRRARRIEWRRVDELQSGMMMRVYAPAARTLTAPVHATVVSEAALAGWLQADGFVGQYDEGTNQSLLQMPGKACPDVRYAAIVFIEPIGEMDVYDIQTVSGCYLTNSVLVHNCFILSVKDTMESILEWYRNEGMIFKYGSGAGLNVSSIRSSQERLAGGGTASGPVSFMRAADASAGVIKSGGKCFRQGTLIATPVGWRPIEFLQRGDLVLTHEGARAIVDFMPNGMKRCLRVRTREGYEVEVTTAHKFAFWNIERGGFETKPIEQFQPGDALCLLVAPSEGGTTIPLVVPEAADPPNATTTVEMRFPRELSEELAYIVGLTYGDGELRTEYPYRVRVAFGKNRADQDAVARFRRYCQHLFGEEPILLGDEPGHQQWGFTRKRFVEFLVANGLAKGRAAFLHFPQALFHAGPEVRAAFLAGVIDADGTYQPRGGWTISSIDRAFLVDLQRLVLSLGVPSKLTLNRQGNGSWQPLYRLSIVGHLFVERLVRRIRAHSSKARLIYKAADGADKGWGYRPSLYPPLVERVERRGGYRIVERTVGINETTGCGALVKLAAHPDLAVAEYAQELSHCVQVRLEAVEPTDIAETYDIEVEGVHLLSANGFYASNTRRAAKMVVLNADHPDVKPFILCKWKEEEKAHKLIDIGYDASIDGEAYSSVFFQNANNSVRVTDEFMRKALSDDDWELRAVTTGDVVERVKARELLRLIAEATWHCGDPGMQFDTTTNDWHTCPNTGRINASNPCSEYVHLDDSACNLSSINLLKFLDEEGNFLVEPFKYAVRILIIAQDIVVDNSSYPTPRIEQTAKDYRELGLGYANLGALLMSLGIPYDSDAGRAWAGALTAILCGHAYEVSGQIAREMGPYAGFARNREPQLRILRKHRSHIGKISNRLIPQELTQAASHAWDESIRLGEEFGVRNSQVTVVAPTGCLVGGTLVSTDRGLLRLARLGNPQGAQWQQAAYRVLTDEGPRPATQFYVNGHAETRRIRTEAGYELCGTPKHRIKVVDPATNAWVWKRFDELQSGDLVPLAMDTVFGEPRSVTLPPLGEPYWASNPEISAPRDVTPDLAELVGYFMGDGSLHSKGLRLCVTAGDDDAIERLRHLSRSLFRAQPHLEARKGYTEVGIHSVALAIWWDACDFAKRVPDDAPDHKGKGYQPHIPDAILATNNPSVYQAFLRGLFEADGSVVCGVPSFSTAHAAFAREVATLLLALGYPTTSKLDTSGWGAADVHGLRMRNASYNEPFRREIGFLGSRKMGGLANREGPMSGKRDYIFLSEEVIEELVPAGNVHHDAGLMSVRRHGGIPRQRALQLHRETGDARVARALGFFYDRIEANEDGGIQPTYDLSVPGNVTYMANGFVSHNTIAFLMDCDTTGVEPDIALIKYKRLVGGGMLKIVNQTAPRALKRLGYSPAEVEAILKHLDERETIEGAPHLKPEHVAVFDCAFKPMHGSRSIHYMGHVRMMGAVQPFISGAISKCVTGDTLVPSCQGLVPIARFYNEEPPDSFKPLEVDIVSIDGVRSTDQFYCGGVQDVIRVELRDGRRITATPNHQLYVASPDGLYWKRMDELVEGDYVAIKLGDRLWAEQDADLSSFVPSKPHGSQKLARIPLRMTPDFAWLLGAYTAEGNITASNWTVAIHNNCGAVQHKLRRIVQELFGLAVAVRQERTVISSKITSKTLVEFLRFCGVGEGAQHKIVPWSVLQSTEPCVRAFVSGVYLDGYIPRNLSKVGFCVASQRLVDELQAILSNLGMRSAQIRKRNLQLGKEYVELNVFGRHAQAFVRAFAFDEPEKHERAQRLLQRTFAQRWADVVPAVDSRAAFAGASRAVKARYEYQAYGNPHTIAWETLKRLVEDPQVPTTDEMEVLIRHRIHFVPVRRIATGLRAPVYDFSVPDAHAFVGNGIINHNTVNLPEEATVEDIVQAYTEAWKLGIKALAIYRDGSKRVQPLSTGKQDKADGKAESASAAKPEPYRRRLPDERQAVIHKFSIGGHEGYITVGMFEDGAPGELFIVMSKEGSTLSGVMDSFATAVSLALQYGVPLKVLIDKFSHVRFEPSGVTNNAEIRFAKSVVDYIFRWMALRFLPKEEAQEAVLDRPSSVTPAAAESPAPAAAATEPRRNPLEQHERRTFVAQADAPACSDCGSLMVRNGNCYKCGNCGSTSGCS